MKAKNTANKESRQTRDLNKMEEKFKIIGVLLSYADEKDRTEFHRLLNSISERSGVSKATIKRWLKEYKKDGLKGLMPKYPKTHLSKLSKECHEALERACEIREKEGISVKAIIKTLESEGLIIKGELSRPTLQRYFQKQGLAKRDLRKQISKNRGALNNGEHFLRYEAKRPFQVFLADITYGPYKCVADDNSGEILQAYISLFMDDRSRYAWITVSQTQDQDCVSLLFKSIMEDYGLAPKHLIVDNGSQYRSLSMQRTCDLCGITLNYTRVRKPNEKGKCERIFRNFEDLDLSLRASQNTITFSVFEKLCHNKFDEYNNTVHSSLDGKTPAQVFAETPHDGIKLSQQTIDYAFAEVCTRNVDQDGTIEVKGITYKADLTDVKRNQEVRIEIHKNIDGSEEVFQRINDVELKKLEVFKPRDALSLNSIAHPKKNLKEPPEKVATEEYSASLLATFREQFKAQGLYTDEDSFRQYLKIFLTPQKFEKAVKEDEDSRSQDQASANKLVNLLSN